MNKEEQNGKAHTHQEDVCPSKKGKLDLETVRAQIAPAPVELNRPIRAQDNPAVRMRQIFGHHIPVRAVSCEVAAQEFAQHGFEDASMNRILERAQMSKGAAYYYFEDKVDVFFTVVQYANECLKLFALELDIAGLTAATFWPTFAELHRQPLLRSFEQPWLFAAVRATGHLSSTTLEREPLATFARQILAWVMAIVKRGQEVGVMMESPVAPSFSDASQKRPRNASAKRR